MRLLSLREKCFAEAVQACGVLEGNTFYDYGTAHCIGLRCGHWQTAQSDVEALDWLDYQKVSHTFNATLAEINLIKSIWIYFYSRSRVSPRSLVSLVASLFASWP